MNMNMSRGAGSGFAGRKIAILATSLLLLSPVMVAAEDSGSAPELKAAQAQNTGGTSAKEAGDQVILAFDLATNKPTINSSNIDSVLSLNNSHSWKDGAGAVGAISWSSDGRYLTVVLSAGTSLPTVAVGDEVTVSGSLIKDATGAVAAEGSEDINGSFGKGNEEESNAPELDSAKAHNTGGTTAKEAGDSIVLKFDEATNKPVINASNIDTVLDLNNSHSWLDGAGALGSATWSSDGKTLTVTLSAGTSLPSVAVGDTVTVAGSVIKDTTATDNATGSETIEGSFAVSNDDEGDNEGDDEEKVGQTCANTLINGRLYKLKGETNTTVYLAAACVLRPFRGAAVFHARGGKFNHIIELDSLSGFTVSDKPALPAAGTLVKGHDRTVWFVEKNGKRKGFASATAFLGLGFRFDQVNEISDDDLNTIETDSTPVVSDTQHPDGALIKCGNSPTVFEIRGGTEFPYTNVDSFELRGHSFAHIATVDCGRFRYVVGVAINN